MSRRFKRFAFCEVRMRDGLSVLIIVASLAVLKICGSLSGNIDGSAGQWSRNRRKCCLPELGTVALYFCGRPTGITGRGSAGGPVGDGSAGNG